MRHEFAKAPDFAQIGTNDNATAVTIPLVNSFVLIDVFDHDGPDRNSQSDQANERIVVGSSGVYRITLSSHSVVGAANKVFETYVYEIAATGSAITGATQADPVVVTSAAHGFSDGDEILIQGVAGMIELNDRIFKVADKAAGTYELTDDGGASPANDIDGSGFAAYTSGGTAYLATRTRAHIHQKFVNANATEPASDSYLVELTAGRRIMLAVAGLTDTTAITPEHLSLSIERVD